MKIKFNVKKFQTISVLLCLLLSMLACSQGYVSPLELTATASASGNLASSIATTPPPTATATNTTPSPSSTSTSLPTFTDVPTKTAAVGAATPTVDVRAVTKPPIQYYTQSGDTLPSIVGRFGVFAGDIIYSEVVPEIGLISPGILLIIPDVLTDVFPSTIVMPDSEVVYSPTAVEFDIEQFVLEAGGYLSTYKQSLSTGMFSGAEIVQRVCIENSVNPRLLLALLEYKSHWVYGQPHNLAETDYPMGWVKLEEKGLYHQLSWVVSQLSIGYYGWRAGSLNSLPFKDGSIKRISPGLNAGSAAVQYLFAQWYEQAEWNGALYGSGSMPELMEEMFGNFFIRAQLVEPLYSPELTQPKLQLPFEPNRVWNFTGGPHSAWGENGALAALDFAPPSGESGCVESNQWVTAMAPGVIVRAGNGAVIEDLDDDNTENTGWNIFYMHIATEGRVAVGTRLETGDKIGHPSCEGGVSTGTHTHIARKYNGEWILAGGPMPFDLSGYIAHDGAEPYEGTLTKGDITITRNANGSRESHITLP